MAYGSAFAAIDDGTDGPIGRVLIVDDSIVARSALARIVDASERFVVAGAVSTAAAAQQFLARHHVEIVLLDLEMPGIDGLTALPDLIAAGDGARVLVVSTAAGAGAAATIQALALGAADTLEKPAPGDFTTRFTDRLVDKLDRLLTEDVAPRGGAAVPTDTRSAKVAAALPDIGAVDLVAIGASTGGIHALSKLLRAIPPDVDVPIVITQHLPVTFMSYFAAQLSVLAGRPCDVAVDHLRVRPGRIYVAPGDAHVRVVALGDGAAALRLSTAPSRSGCMPSVDVMFSSLAQSFATTTLGVVLSGMGRDGSIGAADLIAAGAPVVVQDRESSVVWGMPGAVVNGAGALAMLAPEEIGRLIALQGRPRR